MLIQVKYILKCSFNNSFTIIKTKKKKHMCGIQVQVIRSLTLQHVDTLQCVCESPKADSVLLDVAFSRNEKN